MMASLEWAWILHPANVKSVRISMNVTLITGAVSHTPYVSILPAPLSAVNASKASLAIKKWVALIAPAFVQTVPFAMKMPNVFCLPD